jgi:hypothetical protein
VLVANFWITLSSSSSDEEEEEAPSHAWDDDHTRLWFASYKTRESSTGAQKFEWLSWLASMTSEDVWSCKAAKNSHF